MGATVLWILKEVNDLTNKHMVPGHLVNLDKWDENV